MSTESETNYAAFLEQLAPATKKVEECDHPQFAVCASIARLEDSGKFMAEIRLVCSECREPFRFVGLTPGLSFVEPSVSIDGLEALLPIEPEIEHRLFGGARYVMPHIPARH